MMRLFSAHVRNGQLGVELVRGEIHLAQDRVV